MAVIDMGIFTGVARDWCSDASTDLAWRAAPHWPVRFCLTAAAARFPVLLVAKPLAMTLIQGPFKEVPEGELKLAAAAAQLRTDIWEHGSVRGDHRRRLDRLHGQWVRGAFRQVAERTGQHHVVYVRPRVAWVEAAKLARRRALPIASRAMVWLGDRLMQLVTCAEVGPATKVYAMARQVGSTLGNPPAAVATHPNGPRLLQQARELVAAVQRVDQEVPILRVSALLSSIMRDHAVQEAERIEGRRKGWKIWADEAFSGGARKAHAFLRSGDPSAPVDLQRGRYEEVQVQRQTWEKIWAPANAPVIEALAGRLVAEPGLVRSPEIFQPSQIIEAVKTFSPATAWGPDGLHVRQYAAMAEPSIQALAVFFQLFSESGVAPTPSRAVVNPLVPKPAGGHRPIGIFSSWYRLWGATCKAVGRSWFEAYTATRPALAAAPNRHTVEPIWRVAARTQAAFEDQPRGVPEHFRLCGATVMLDVRKFFDSLCPALVLRLGTEAGLPLWLTRCAVQSYSWPRHLKCGEIISEPVLPSRGVVAGDASAMFLVTAIV